MTRLHALWPFFERSGVLIGPGMGHLEVLASLDIHLETDRRKVIGQLKV
jgi:hypothetical protein